MTRYTNNNSRQEGIKEWILTGFVGLVIIILWSYFQGGAFLLIVGSIWMVGVTSYNIAKIKRNRIIELVITEDAITVKQKEKALQFNWKEIEAFKVEKGITISDKNIKRLGICKNEWNEFFAIQMEIEKYIPLKEMNSKSQSLIGTILNGLLTWG